MPEYVETDLHVYCSDSTLLKKIQKLVFTKNEQGETRFTMKKLLPLPPELGGIPCYQLYNHYWRKLLLEVDQDGKEYHKNISENKFDVHFTTPSKPVHMWFNIFYHIVELLYRDSEPHPKPELVVLYAYGIFDTKDQGFACWEPVLGIVHERKFPDKNRERYSSLFGQKWIDRFGDVWW